MTIQVKICGVSDAAGFDAAVREGADWLGFVFLAASPRAVSPARAAELSARHPGGSDRNTPGRVGLFVRASEQEIARCLDSVRLDALQLYDTAERARAIALRFALPVWLACPVADAAELPAQAPGTERLSGVERLLVEARAPAGASRPGGNGVTLDWSMLRGWRAPLPWLLAGGLDAGNVGEAIRQSGAQAVDVSSGVESRPGVKDPARIAAFIAAAHAAHARSIA